MQKCKNCNQEVVYIPCSSSEVVKCDAELKIGYTKNGRKIEMYEIHKCRSNENENVKQ